MTLVSFSAPSRSIYLLDCYIYGLFTFVDERVLNTRAFAKAVGLLVQYKLTQVNQRTQIAIGVMDEDNLILEAKLQRY
jgi:hypothetical protein